MRIGAAPLGAKGSDVLQKLDHQSIYLLIAGSYTPFCLVTLRGAWGWSLFGVVWGLAVIGSLQEFWAPCARPLGRPAFPGSLRAGCSTRWAASSMHSTLASGTSTASGICS